MCSWYPPLPTARAYLAPDQTTNTEPYLGNLNDDTALANSTATVTFYTLYGACAALPYLAAHKVKCWWGYPVQTYTINLAMTFPLVSA